MTIPDMSGPSARRLALSSIIVALCAHGASAQDVSREDIVKALTPDYSGTRGLVIEGEVPPPPSIDLQIQFEYNEDTLTEEALITLRALAEALRDQNLSTLSFDVIGHTDSAGSDSYNMDLSNRRAASVVLHLTRAHRIPETQLHSSGMGETQLALPSDPRADINRRVEIRTRLR